MKKSLSGKIMLNKRETKKNETHIEEEVRLLIVVNILGSTGPIKFVVNENDTVSTVIEKVLKLYARDSRLPVLGHGIDNFLLYRINSGSDDLNLSQTIGSAGVRYFGLCKRQIKPEAQSDVVARKVSNGRTRLKKSCVFQCIIPSS